ncbi:MAG: type I restriction endonuclease subunit R [Aquificota bacterium]|nr:MAG: type I restriction endonuclease subunit R [Aquificota bacterium]
MMRWLDEEHQVENSFLAQLKRLGWEIYRQNKEDPEDTKEITGFNKDLEPIYGTTRKFRTTFREVILEDVLRQSIKRINPWIEEDQIDYVVRRLKEPQANSLFEANREIHELLLENIPVSENRKTGEKSPSVYIIDFKNPENNSFIAISQFKVNIPGTEKHIVPDIVLFVNGLPLVVVECKSPSRADPIGEAIEQIFRYSNRREEKEGNEKLFWYNFFSVATARYTAKYGTITSDYEHFVEWKDPYPYALSDIDPTATTITSQQILVQGMLNKNTLIELLHTFTIFKDNIKVVPRYQQYRAVKKIIERIKNGKTPEEKGGIVWHTQGSGKSLTMMYVVRAMFHDEELRKYKVVFITDRKDLERQLEGVSKGVGFTVHVARSVEHLKELLRTNTPDLVMGLVHKFQERELKTPFPVLNTSPNILVMIDEAHRSQYKFLGANLRHALPNAVKIAFTGTPIEKTEKTFGDYIDKYSIRQAVEDGVTVEIVYEGRVHGAEISDEESANRKFEDVFKEFSEDERRLILGRTREAYLEAEQVIRDKAKDMIEHYITHVFPNGLKAQVVAVSRFAAIRYKHALELALREKIKELEEKGTNLDLETLKRLKVAVVISASPNDDPNIYKREYTDENEHKKNIASFRLPFGAVTQDGLTGDVGILVVNNMLITGFDAPIEQVMYLDNILKDHNLLQAIARVNRVYNKNKSCGFVVDYVGVLKHLEEALAIYADEDIQEITQVVKNKSKSLDDLKSSHRLIEEFFKKHGIFNWRQDIDECVDLLVDEKTKDEFISLFRKFSRALDAVLPDPRALRYVSDLKILGYIKESARNRYRDDKLSLKDASKKIREIVEEHLLSQGIDPKVPPTPLFDNAFLEKLKAKPIKAKAQELEYAILEHIEKHYEEDPEFYERFSDRLKRVLEEYRENWEEIFKELEKLREDMKKGREAENTFGLDPKREMPFFGVLKMSLFGKEPIENLREEDIGLLLDLTRDVLSILGREISTEDFWDNYNRQKRVRSYIITQVLLPKGVQRKLLKEKRNEIAQRIIELAYHIFGRKTDAT